MRASVVLFALTVGACGGKGPVPAAEPTPVGADVVRSGPAEPDIVINGVLVTRDEWRLSFKVPGIVRSITVEEGQGVRAGQLLATLEPTEVDAQLEQASELADKAGRDLARGTRLRTDEVISEEELEALRTQAAVAEAGLRTARFNRSYSNITAPRDGVVLRKLAEVREYVQPGRDVLVVGPVAGGFIVRAGLADRDLVRLALGDPATISLDAFPGRELGGQLSVLPAAADRATGLFPVEIQVAPTDLRLVSGLVARVRVAPAATAEQRLPHAPIAAVIEADGDRAAVFVVTDEVARRRPVRVAFIAGNTVAIREGLETGETVVTDGALFLRDGERVQVVSSGEAARLARR
jgi:RND family efflux transporter MFP subunit